ncbi:hypothetical protein [Halorubellus sp. PRR65]|uniref:hypothetical protein n=1 Tax=Halorubellus sp. PRR65 TaxID=3098148 RepID=UPI002B256B92|nr:hypothetical protein [Halorubellus sp. PRR65]
MDYTWQYYDLVLLGIVAAMAAGVLVGFATPIAPTTSVTATSLVAVGIMGHGLFVRGPVDDVDDLTDEVEPEEVPVAPQALAD